MKWVRLFVPNPGAAIRLFCFPFAGGGASAFRPWCAGLPDFIEICPIQTPGREERHGEPLFTRMPDLADAAASRIRPYLDKPFAFYGHSLGALLAFEVARSLRRSGAPLPLTMFLSAHRAPHLPLGRRTFHDLPDGELIAEIRDLNGTPEALLDDRDALEYLLPIVRADLEVCDTYRWVEEPPLPVPLVVYGGALDRSVPPQHLEGWASHTTGSFALQIFPGNHFFLRSQQVPLLRSLESHLAAYLP